MHLGGGEGTRIIVHVKVELLTLLAMDINLSCRNLNVEVVFRWMWPSAHVPKSC